MENKSFLTIAMMVLCSFSTLFAQVSDGTPDTVNTDKQTQTGTETPGVSKKGDNYSIKESNGKSVFVQRLAWENVDDILGFEFELDFYDKKTNRWKQVEKIIIKKSHHNVSLPAGKYRYRATIINVLKQREKPGDYCFFEVYKAYQPKVTTVRPGKVYFEEIEDNIITISGDNFHEDTMFSLVNKNTSKKNAGTLVELDEDGRKASIEFPLKKIESGDYVFMAEDPSRLKAMSDTIPFRFKKPFDIYCSLGYAFTVFAVPETFKTYFNSQFSALGAVIRVTAVPIKRWYGTFGFNFTVSGMPLIHKEEAFHLKAGFILPQLQASYIKRLIKKRLSFDVHAGLGTAFLFSTQFTYPKLNVSSQQKWFWGVTVNFGAGLIVYLYKHLYLEINIDNIVPIREAFPKYILQPQCSLGWEF